jgi:hypothetical protein
MMARLTLAALIEFWYPAPRRRESPRKRVFAGNQHPADRPSDFVLKYLGGKGYRVIPVNEGIARQSTTGSPADHPPRIRPAHGLSDKLTAAQDSLGKRGGLRTLGPGGTATRLELKSTGLPGPHRPRACRSFG